MPIESATVSTSCACGAEPPGSHRRVVEDTPAVIFSPPSDDFFAEREQPATGGGCYCRQRRERMRQRTPRLARRRIGRFSASLASSRRAAANRKPSSLTVPHHIGDPCHANPQRLSGFDFFRDSRRGRGTRVRRVRCPGLRGRWRGRGLRRAGGDCRVGVDSRGKPMGTGGGLAAGAVPQPRRSGAVLHHSHRRDHSLLDRFAGDHQLVQRRKDAHQGHGAGRRRRGVVLEGRRSQAGRARRGRLPSARSAGQRRRRCAT